MSPIDIVLLIPVLWGAYKGFTKGLIIEIFTLIGLVAGVYAGLHFSGFVTEYLKDYTTWNHPLVAFGLVFILVVVGVYFLGKAIEKFVDLVAMGIVNKVLGAIFGILKFALAISVIIFFFERINDKWQFVNPTVFDDTVLYTPIQQVSEVVIPKLIELKEEVPKGVNSLEM